MDAARCAAKAKAKVPARFQALRCAYGECAGYIGLVAGLRVGRRTAFGGIERTFQ